MNARFLAIAQDPRIIPGVHHSCDEWCDYCQVTDRCLEFRCTADFRKQYGRRSGDETFTSLEEAVAFTRDVAGVEGRRTEELDALLSQPPGESEIATSDPLADVAWQYALGVTAALVPVPLTIAKAATTERRPSGPSPKDVVDWYHVRIYMQLFRALVGKKRKGCGPDADMDEVNGDAKLALTSVQRSRAALQSLRTDANEVIIVDLVSLLDALERGIDQRFPAARSFVRLGLDVPVA